MPARYPGRGPPPRRNAADQTDNPWQVGRPGQRVSQGSVSDSLPARHALSSIPVRARAWNRRSVRYTGWRSCPPGRIP